MLKEFKAFAMRGNVVDLAVGIIIGAAFGAIVNSLVADVLMPPLGLAIGNVDFANLFAVLKEGTNPGPYASLKAAKDVGAVTINYGVFLNAIIQFVIQAFAIFMVVKVMNKMKAAEEAAPSAPPPPPRSEVLLEEIKNLLAKK